MENNRRIRVGITHGDINGIGYELILKAFADPTMLELCTPIVYGSPKVLAYHRKALELQTNYNIVAEADDAQEDKLNIVGCTVDELKVELGKAATEAGQAALDALQKAVSDCLEGKIDVLVTTPVNPAVIGTETAPFPGQTAYLEEAVGEGQQALTIRLKDDLRMALVTDRIPVREVAPLITRERITEKLSALHRSLKEDFSIDNPRIAVLSLNPLSAGEGQMGKEEQEAIVPAIEELSAKGLLCFGPYAADELMASGNYRYFDAILSMYHDQALASFLTLTAGEGVSYTAGLPLVITEPLQGNIYEKAGQGVTDESSLRQAIYVALDVVRSRAIEHEIHLHPLRKQYYEKRDDSDKLKLDTIDDDL